MKDEGLQLENSKLRKGSLNIIETIALSAAIMAPSANTSITVPLVIGISGFSVGITFIFAILLTILLSIAIVKFNRHSPSAGSLYTFTKIGLGKQTGFVSGWSLFLTYFLFALGCSAALGSYMSGVFELMGIHINWLIFSLAFLAIAWLLAYRNINLSTRVMLLLEGVSITLILILVAVIFAQVGQSTGISTAPLAFNQNSLASMARGTVMALVAFAGFEGTSCLGEESRNPKKSIPVTITGTVIFIGLFLMISGYSQVIGFGANQDGITALISSLNPLNDLAVKYISPAYALVVTLGISLSLFSCVIGCVCASSRILFSMSRDGIIHKNLSRTHKKFSTPHIAVSLVMIIMIAIQIIYLAITGQDSGSLFLAAFSIASLAVLVAYLLTTLSGVVYFRRIKAWKVRHLILPLIAAAVLVFALACNIYPVPAFPSNLYPYIILVCILIGLGFSKLTKHPGSLQADEG
jgi:Amino acid transporters